jgi:hypothetical protein
MRESTIQVQDAGTNHVEGYRTGVSLHSHTLHSHESLDFIYFAARKSALLRYVIREGEIRYRQIHGTDLDLNRGWWTPPLAPLDAFVLEAKQLEDLGLQPFVSLTDHDSIEAPMSLQAVEPEKHIPVSVEWTVPYGGTFFHIGVHNLLASRARMMMKHLAAYTAAPAAGRLTELLAELDADPAALVVFNHPLWDEKGVGADVHCAALTKILRTRGEFFHALEINGLRPWSENKQVVELAEVWNKPVISGGDRHTVEPNATVNLTNAADFREFVAEVRNDLHSNVLLLPHYHEAHASRIFHNMLDVFRTYENHGCGWKEWGDRVFYSKHDGHVQSLSQMWGERPPRAVGIFAGFMRFAGQRGVRKALRSMAGFVPAEAD